MFAILLSSLGVGVIHALAGPDHYVPFIALKLDRGWTMAKTLFIASFASLLHVGSSVVIGMAGIMLGKELFNLQAIESIRGTAGGYLLIALGDAYTLYAIYKSRKPPHKSPPYGGGDWEASVMKYKKTIVGWTLFFLFVLGPCEPLIPLMFAAIPLGMNVVLLVSMVFGIATFVSANTAVLLGVHALKPLAARISHSFAHLAAGIAIFITGIIMQFI